MEKRNGGTHLVYSYSAETMANGVKAGKKNFFYMTGIWSLNLTSRTREADGFDFILVMYCPSTNLILFH